MTELSTFKQFETLPTIDGFDIIDVQTGHAVDHRETAREAAGAAFRLNQVARDGNIQRALTRR